MIMPFEYIYLIITVVLLIFGFIVQDYLIKTLSCIMLMVFGVWIGSQGIEHITNLAIQTMAAISIGLGFYIWMNESYELMK